MDGVGFLCVLMLLLLLLLSQLSLRRYSNFTKRAINWAYLNEMVIIIPRSILAESYSFGVEKTFYVN